MSCSFTRLALFSTRCLLFVTASAVACSLACADRERAPHPDVLLVTFDTLRADFVGAYGFPDSNTPGLDALAARGVLFENAIAASTVTVPAHVAIMTGHWPRETSVGSRNGKERLDEALVTAAERFGEAGYDTAAFVGNFVLRSEVGLSRGFDHYDDELPTAEQNRSNYFERLANDTADQAIAWLEDRDGDRPFFLWLHLQDPHGPYTPPPEFAGRSQLDVDGAEVELKVLSEHLGRDGVPAYQRLAGARRAITYINRYADEIAYADHHFSRVQAAAERAAGALGLVTLVTADHGEALGEDGFFFQHGQSTRPELARVPMLLAAPQLPAGRHSGYVSHVDVAPTLLQLAGLEALPGVVGVAVARAEPPPERWLLVDVEGEVGAYREGIYIRARGPGAMNMAQAEGALRFSVHEPVRGDGVDGAGVPAAARAEVERYLREQTGVKPIDGMSERDLERLRALGYVADEPRDPALAD